MIKLIGGILIIIASVMVSYNYETREKEKLAFYSEYTRLVKHIKKQIEYFSMPLNEIYSSFDTENRLLLKIKSNKLDEIKHYFPNDYEAITDFFQQIGKGFKKEQLSLCDSTIESLESTLKIQSEEFSKKVKISRAISLFVGACIVILII